MNLPSLSRRSTRILLLAGYRDVVIEGSPLRLVDLQRFFDKVASADPDECWEWSATKTPKGYGHFWCRGKLLYAHRFAYQAFVGEIPDGLVIDHLCRNRGCVNPAHMEPTTSEENVRRGVNWWRERTHCKHGHEYTPENTLQTASGRKCRECNKLKNRRYRATSPAYARRKVGSK